jgi:predicted kinase
MGAPLLVVVTGMPASGKTTVAQALSRRLLLPLIAKDEIKEHLYDALGSGDKLWSERLGGAAYALMFAVARSILATGTGMIVEANFFRGQEGDFALLPAHRPVQVHCDAPLAVLIDRFRDRARHPGHHDEQMVNELATRFESGAHAPLDLPGNLVRVDTTASVDEHALVERLRAST